MPLSKELVRAVRSRIKDDPGLSTRLLAAEFGVPEAQVLTALPVAMRMRAKTEDFPAIWQELCRITGRRLVLGGHGLETGEGGQESGQEGGPSTVSSADRLAVSPIQATHVGSIWFMTATQAREPAVRFLDRAGALLFEVALPQEARGETGILDDLKKRYGVLPSPKIRCKGCKHCTCHLEERPAA